MSELLVTIPVADYTALVVESARAKMFEVGILAGAKLSYSGDDLTFDYDVVKTIFRSALPEEYYRKLAELKGGRGERYDAV